VALVIIIQLQVLLQLCFSFITVCCKVCAFITSCVRAVVQSEQWSSGESSGVRAVVQKNAGKSHLQNVLNWQRRYAITNVLMVKRFCQ